MSSPWDCPHGDLKESLLPQDEGHGQGQREDHHAVNVMRPLSLSSLEESDENEMNIVKKRRAASQGDSIYREFWSGKLAVIKDQEPAFMSNFYTLCMVPQTYWLFAKCGLARDRGATPSKKAMMWACGYYFTLFVVFPIYWYYFIAWTDDRCVLPINQTMIEKGFEKVLPNLCNPVSLETQRAAVHTIMAKYTVWPPAMIYFLAKRREVFAKLTYDMYDEVGSDIEVRLPKLLYPVIGILLASCYAVMIYLFNSNCLDPLLKGVQSIDLWIVLGAVIFVLLLFFPFLCCLKGLFNALFYAFASASKRELRDLAKAAQLAQTSKDFELLHGRLVRASVLSTRRAQVLAAPLMISLIFSLFAIVTNMYFSWKLSELPEYVAIYIELSFMWIVVIVAPLCRLIEVSDKMEILYSQLCKNTQVVVHAPGLLHAFPDLFPGVLIWGISVNRGRVIAFAAASMTALLTSFVKKFTDGLHS